MNDPTGHEEECEAIPGKAESIMGKKIRIILVIIAFLSLFAPLDDGTKKAANFFLATGSLQLLFGVIPNLISIPSQFIFHISLSEGSLTIIKMLMFIWWGIRDFLTSFAFILWTYAIPVLIIWNLCLLKNKKTWSKVLYRFWLILSLISSIYMSIDYGLPGLLDPDPGAYSPTGIGFWANPILLLIAVFIEIAIGFSERKARQTPIPVG